MWPQLKVGHVLLSSSVVCVTLSSPSQKSCLPPFSTTPGGVFLPFLQRVALSSSLFFNVWRCLPPFSSIRGVVFTIKEELSSSVLYNTRRCLLFLFCSARNLPLPPPPYPLPPFSPSPISLMVSVDVKHHV